MRRAVVYLRVSTIDQTTANQERELREIAGRMGCDIVKVYMDHGDGGRRSPEHLACAIRRSQCGADGLRSFTANKNHAPAEEAELRLVKGPLPSRLPRRRVLRRLFPN
jgi:hypothetical protein